MNVLAFIAFLIALILKLVGVHVDWVVYLIIVGGLLLSVGGVGSMSWTPWRK